MSRYNRNSGTAERRIGSTSLSFVVRSSCSALESFQNSQRTNNVGGHEAEIVASGEALRIGVHQFSEIAPVSGVVVGRAAAAGE
jgi:hypothetical protein